MIRHIVIASLLLAAALHGTAPAHAAADSECLVALKTRSGWSKEHRVKVVFVTGLELSRVASTLPIRFHQVYALIFHDSGLPTVARLDATLPGVQREFTERDLARLYALYSEPLATQIAGEGRDLKWRLRGRSGTGWADESVALQTSVSK
jgi:hypothetical protein